MEKSWKHAIIKVLSEESAPLHYTEIAEKVLSNGYYSTDGATPAATVNAQISSSIKHDGIQSPFKRVAKGVFTLADNAPCETAQSLPKSDLTDDESGSVIQCFGMYWQRDLVVWRSDPKIYGKQQAKAKPVNFGAQKGIYILYDHHTVVYVGRSIDRPLGKRLFEHTVDRLGSRWDRFSWFGLMDVTQEGGLREVVFNGSLASLVMTLESLLIEALEPPQNRKRGDDFAGIEYIQDVDPEIKERELQNTLRAIEHKLRGDS